MSSRSAWSCSWLRALLRQRAGRHLPGRAESQVPPAAQGLVAADRQGEGRAPRSPSPSASDPLSPPRLSGFSSGGRVVQHASPPANRQLNHANRLLTQRGFGAGEETADGERAGTALPPGLNCQSVANHTATEPGAVGFRRQSSLLRALSPSS